MSHATFADGMVEYTPGHIASEAAALAEIDAMGWHALVRDVAIAEDEELHWHDFDSVAFIISGTLRVMDEKDELLEAGPGTRIRAAPGVLHREIAGAAYRVVFGFKIKLSEFTQPVNKPASTLG